MPEQWQTAIISPLEVVSALVQEEREKVKFSLENIHPSPDSHYDLAKYDEAYEHLQSARRILMDMYSKVHETYSSNLGFNETYSPNYALQELRKQHNINLVKHVASVEATIDNQNKALGQPPNTASTEYYNPINGFHPRVEIVPPTNKMHSRSPSSRGRSRKISISGRGSSRHSSVARTEYFCLHDDCKALSEPTSRPSKSVFRYMSKLSDHYDTHSPRNFQCLRCNELLSRYRCFRKHHERKHGGEDETYTEHQRQDKMLYTTREIRPEPDLARDHRASSTCNPLEILQAPTSYNNHYEAASTYSTFTNSWVGSEYS